MSASTTFQCPGEPDVIGRAVHLGRLMRGYAACRECPNRHDTAGLLPTQQRRLAECNGPPCSTSPDGVAVQAVETGGATFAGTLHNDIDAATVLHVSMAVGARLWRKSDRPPDSPPRVVLAGDERPWTVELVAAAVEGLRRTGCRVIDVGGGTAAVAQLAMRELNADAALLAGNPTDRPLYAGLRLWRTGDSPWPSLAELARQPVDRPTRHYGALRRQRFDAAYLARLSPYFHGLRPLTVVVESGCLPLWRYLRELTREAACGFTANRDAAAHLAIWTDGNGEAFHILDERGVAVSSARLAAALGRDEPDGASPPIRDALQSLAQLLALLSQSDRPLSRVLDG